MSIKWAFPTAGKRDRNFNSPVLYVDSAIWAGERNDVLNFWKTCRCVFLEF